MHDLEWFTELLTRVTYKPGWTAEIEQVYERGPTRFSVLILCEGPVTHDAVTGRSVPDGRLYSPCTLSWSPDQTDDGDMTMSIFSAYVAAECHEMREWIKLDGETLWNPHRQDGRIAWEKDFDTIISVSRTVRDQHPSVVNINAL